jgi:hypothetical protein
VDHKILQYHTGTVLNLEVKIKKKKDIGTHAPFLMIV